MIWCWQWRHQIINIDLISQGSKIKPTENGDLSGRHATDSSFRKNRFSRWVNLGIEGPCDWEKTLLLQILFLDQNELQAAQNFLEQAAQANLPELLKTLSEILAHGGNSAVARRQAGLQLKNRLASHDDAIKAQYQVKPTKGVVSSGFYSNVWISQERWLQMDPNVKDYVKTNILGALGSEGYRPSAAAQCIQYVAVVELPRNMWPNLIQV